MGSSTIIKAMSSQRSMGYNTYGFPSQTVSIAEKNTIEWQTECMNFMLEEARSFQSDRSKDLKKIKMLSDEYDYSDHTWAVDPLALKDDKEELYGATDPIQHYPIMNTPLNTILGERINRTTQWFCICDSPDSMNEYYRQKGEDLFEFVQGSIMSNVLNKIIMTAQKNGEEINDEFMQKAQELAQQQSPESIQSYYDDTYVDVTERVHNRILKNIYRRNDLESEFIEGFRMSTIVAKEYYCFDVVNNHLKIKNLSPFNVFRHRSSASKWASDSQYAGYRLFLSMSSIIDSYRDKLSIEDINYLLDKSNPSGRNSGYKSVTGIKSISYETNVFADWHGNTFDNINIDMVDNMLHDYMTTGNKLYDRSTLGLYEVVQAYWKSYRKVGFLETFLAGDTPLVQMVDENYQPDIEAGEEVKWEYLNQVYQGCIIDNDIVFNVGPYPFQIFDENNPDYCPLPIEGGEYNDFGGKCIAIADLMLPWAELYDIVANELKKDLKKAMGKVMFMSIDNIPNIPGFDMNKFLYWCKEFGIAWTSNNGKNQNSFSHYQAADMSFADQIVSKINLLDKIKMNCDSFAGFSENRVAGQSNAPTQGQDQQKLISSVNQTEYYFWKHSKICERVLTLGLNIEKILVRKRKDKSVLFDDMEQRFIDADLDKATAENSNIFVINNTQLLQKKDALRQMAAAAAGKMGNSEDMSDIIMADTFHEIKKVVKTIRKRNEQQAQAQQQAEQEQFRLEMEQKEKDRNWEQEKHYSTLESEERQTYMQTFSRQQDNLKDADQNGIPDILEHEKVFETIADNSRKHQREMNKIFNDNDNKKRELSLKGKELGIKEKEIEIKKEQNRIAKENQANDLKIAQQNAKGRNRK
jgi:hypothetical protein